MSHLPKKDLKQLTAVVTPFQTCLHVRNHRVWKQSYIFLSWFLQPILLTCPHPLLSYMRGLLGLLANQLLETSLDAPLVPQLDVKIQNNKTAQR